LPPEFFACAPLLGDGICNFLHGGGTPVFRERLQINVFEQLLQRLSY